MKKLFGGFFSKKENKEKLDKGLEKTKEGFFSKISKAVAGKSKVDDDVLDELEEILVQSDVGVNTTIKIIQKLEERVAKDKYLGSEQLDLLIRETITELLNDAPDTETEGFVLPSKMKPYVMLVVGVNGVGKTTTIGKLAARYKQEGYKVLLGAADTFRAAAVDQLKLWAERAEVDIVEKGMNIDPSSVAFEAAKQGVEGQYDVVLIDTAGRLHNKVNLMNELTKIKRVIQKFKEDAPHEVLLVLDGSTGQNAVAQAREFMSATEITSMAVTKLDGTANGGVVIGISDEFKIPIRFIGVGEKVDDLQVFDKHAFVDSLFSKSKV